MAPHNKRFSAKLLFQFRVQINGDDGIYRTVEERICTVAARSAADALRLFKVNARETEIQYINNDGNKVFFEFIGVMEMIELGIECNKNEVWYEILTLKIPMERKSEFVPPETELNAFIQQGGIERTNKRKRKA